MSSLLANIGSVSLGETGFIACRRISGQRTAAQSAVGAYGGGTPLRTNSDWSPFWEQDFHIPPPSRDFAYVIPSINIR